MHETTIHENSYGIYQPDVYLHCMVGKHLI